MNVENKAMVEQSRDKSGMSTVLAESHDMNLIDCRPLSSYSSNVSHKSKSNDTIKRGKKSMKKSDSNIGTPLCNE